MQAIIGSDWARMPNGFAIMRHDEAATDMVRYSVRSERRVDALITPDADWDETFRNQSIDYALKHLAKQIIEDCKQLL